MVELNETNCKEFTADDFEAKMKELHTKELRKAIAKNNKTQYRSEEWKASEKELTDLKKDYAETYGTDELVKVLIGKASSFGKLSNMKGCGYGNM